MYRRPLALAITALALSGCASTATSAGSAVPAGSAGSLQRGGAGSAAPGADANIPATTLTTGIVVGTPPSGDIERSVTAVYTVPAGGFLVSFDGVIARAVGLGGYVVSSGTQPDSSGRIVSGAVTLKVPAAQIAQFLNGMPSAFVASAINFSSVDHTAQFVDVNARLAAAHAHLQALTTLLARATNLTDITTLEQEVATVQAEVDADQGELNLLSSSVDMATATIRLSERGVQLAAAPVPNAVSGGIGKGWDNAVKVSGAVLEGIVSAVPLVVLLAMATLAWRWATTAASTRRRTRPVE